jgi:hypothetical protein
MITLRDTSAEFKASAHSPSVPLNRSSPFSCHDQVPRPSSKYARPLPRAPAITERQLCRIHESVTPFPPF